MMREDVETGEIERRLRRWEKIRRVLYIVLLAGIIIPLVRPIGIPITIWEQTRIAYDIAEALPENSMVMFDFQMDVMGYPESRPAVRAWMRQTISNKHRIAIICSGTDGPILAEIELNSLIPEDWIYGEDYVHLGFLPGGEVGISSFIADIWGTVKRDYYGNPVEDLPIMKDLKNLDSIDLLFANRGVMWIHQASPIRKDTKIIVSHRYMVVTGDIAYQKAGLIDGFVDGVRMGSEYELLIGRPGIGVATMDAMSIACLIAFVGTLIANVQFYSEKYGIIDKIRGKKVK